jgi:hypothetical protein
MLNNLVTSIYNKLLNIKHIIFEPTIADKNIFPDELLIKLY